jgi:demethoxyubiquinone hydroxylase (CLK1/Coq7/Cat5 family)
MVSSGMLRRAALVRTDVSEDLSASFIRVTRIGELGTTLAITSNRRTLLRCVAPVRTDVSTDCSSSIIRVKIIGELGTLAVTSNRNALRRNTVYYDIVPPKHRFL